MSIKVKPILGATLFAAATIAAVMAIQRSGPAQTGPLAAAADGARRDLEAQLRAQREALMTKARAAVDMPRLRAALKAHVDAATLVDLFTSERWWQPIRDEFRVSRVIVDRETATLGKFETAGEEQSLLAVARKEGASAGVLVVKGQPYLVTAARVGALPADDSAAVLLLAKPCDSVWLSELALAVQAGLMVSDDRAPLMTAGTPTLRGYLQGIAPGSNGGTATDPDGRWGAASLDLGGGVRLWALREVPGAASVLPLGRGWHWGAAAGLLGMAGLLVSLRRRATFPMAPMAPMASMTPMAPMAPMASTAHLPVDRPVQPLLSGTAMLAPPLTNGANGSLEGKVFGRYRLVKKIADGGMSEIYRAVATGPEGFTHTFVVKRLKPELTRVKEAVSQFIDEARMQSSLAHSNLVPVFDFGTLNNDYYMTEEYVVGRNVLHFSERCVALTGYPMDRRIAYYIAHETLQALHYAHTRLNPAGEALEIVHRDVSSINIMVASSGDVKLFDFGIAKANSRVIRTQLGTIKGNAHFMSPEQARGHAVDARSDVFCVGLVLYFCLTNQMLYSGVNDLEVLWHAARGPARGELEMIDMLDSPAPDILRRALASDPGDRFQTAGQFAAALAPHIAGAKSVTANLVEALFGDELREEMSA